MPRLVIIIETENPEELYAELNSCKSVNGFTFIDEIDPDVILTGITDVTLAN